MEKEIETIINLKQSENFKNESDTFIRASTIEINGTKYIIYAYQKDKASSSIKNKLERLIMNDY